jgi:hypothetical protein
VNTLPKVRPMHEPMTMEEARLLGRASQRLTDFRHLMGKIESGGQLTIMLKNGTFTQSLRRDDIEAAISLLIERERLFLATYNVETEA